MLKSANNTNTPFVNVIANAQHMKREKQET